MGAVLLSAGCSAVGPDYLDGTRPAQLATATRDHCPSSVDQIPSRDNFGQFIGPGRLPDGFRPVRAVRCTWDERYFNDAATRSEITMEEFRSPSVTAALSASLLLPDQEFTPGSHMACSAVATAPEFLILVDANGQAFSPRLPQTPCSDPRDEVARATADLPWAEHKSYHFKTSA